MRLSTDDGSVGRKGLVTDLLDDELSSANGRAVIYACGPSAMLKAVSNVASDYGVDCLVSLERAMACGVGACLGCAVMTGCEGNKNDGALKMVCSDGPVFNSKDIDWDVI